MPLSQVILVWSLMTFTSPAYGGVPFPGWGLALGWCMTAFVLVWIPAIAGWKLLRAEGNLWKVWGSVHEYLKVWIPWSAWQRDSLSFPQRLKTLCSPAEDWHPFLDAHRGERYSKESCQTRGDDTIDPNVISGSWLWGMFHTASKWAERWSDKSRLIQRKSPGA